MNKPTKLFEVHYIETRRQIRSTERIDDALRQRIVAFLATHKGIV